MTTVQPGTDYKDLFEYHGNTTIERVRTRGESVIWRDWIVFNTVEEAETFFNACC
jgi:hypothetical protein